MGSLEEQQRSSIVAEIGAGSGIIIRTLEEGYFQPPILLHSLPMDTRAIIRLSCGIFLDGFAGQTSFHRNGSLVGYYSESATLPLGYFSDECYSFYVECPP